jgi:hypothetical protein
MHYIRFQDKLFTLKKQIVDDPKYNSDKKLNVLNILYGSNKVLRKDGMLWFLQEIEDAEIITWLPKEN